MVEVRNALIAGERRRRLTRAETTSFLRRLGRLPIVTDRDPDEVAVPDLARQHRLTVYDAAYLEVARRQAIPLATTDDALIRAAPRVGVPLIAAD